MQEQFHKQRNHTRRQKKIIFGHCSAPARAILDESTLLHDSPPLTFFCWPWGQVCLISYGYFQEKIMTGQWGDGACFACSLCLRIHMWCGQFCHTLVNSSALVCPHPLSLAPSLPCPLFPFVRSLSLSLHTHLHTHTPTHTHTHTHKRTHAHTRTHTHRQSGRQAHQLGVLSHVQPVDIHDNSCDRHHVAGRGLCSWCPSHWYLPFCVCAYVCV